MEHPSPCSLLASERKDPVLTEADMRRIAITLMLLAAVGTAVPAVAAMHVGEFVFPQDPELTEFAPSFGRKSD